MIIWTIKLYALFYIGMKLLEKYEEQSKGTWKYYFWKVIVGIYAVVFIILDVLYDIFIGSLWFLRLPEWSERDKTFTARLKLMKKTETGWRYDLAVDFCNLLNRADEGHC